MIRKNESTQSADSCANKILTSSAKKRKEWNNNQATNKANGKINNSVDW